MDHHIFTTTGNGGGKGKNNSKKKKKVKRNIAAPRAMRGDTAVGAVLIALEVRDCDCPKVCLFRGGEGCPGPERCRECPSPRDCRHMAAVDHDVPISDWVELMYAHDPEGMSDRPLAPAAGTALTEEARLALYEERAQRGEALFHPDDSVRCPTGLVVCAEQSTGSKVLLVDDELGRSGLSPAALAERKRAKAKAMIRLDEDDDETGGKKRRKKKRKQRQDAVATTGEEEAITGRLPEGDDHDGDDGSNNHQEQQR